MERLACNQCKGIICADSGDGQRVISQIGEVRDGRYIVFPENVGDCPRRKTVEIKQEGRIFDQIPP